MSDARITGDRRHRWTYTALGVVVGWFATIMCAVWVTASAHANLASAVYEVNTRVADHEIRLRLVENSQLQIAVDVRWIRESLTRQPTQPVRPRTSGLDPWPLTPGP